MINKIIINADDLGISEDVNTAIEQAIKLQVISSTTIIVNAPAFRRAVAIAKKHPRISIGIHLNLIEFAPLTKQKAFFDNCLLDDRGCFIKGAIFNLKSVSKELQNAIYEEWKAQIDKLLAAGIIPSHIDSHQHVHGLNQLSKVLIKLMKEYKFSKLRLKLYVGIKEMLLVQKYNKSNSISQTNSVNNHRLNKKGSFILRRVDQILGYFNYVRWRNQFHQEGFKTTDVFFSFQTYFYCMQSRLKNKNKVIELMVHPGHVKYENETQLLYENIEEYRNNNIIINYNDL